MPMSFEEFLATVENCDDLTKRLPGEVWGITDQTPPPSGNIYAGSLYIEAIQPWWPQSAQDAGRWYLILGNSEWITDDLRELECRLYRYALEEGVVS